MRALFICPIFALALVGCHRPLSQPELKDPVYLDIKRDLNKAGADISITEKSLAKTKSDYENAPIRTGQKKDAQDAYFETQHDYERAIERYRYLGAKLKTRQKEDRSRYQEALQDHKQWPDPGDFVTYLTEKRLSSAPRQWNPDARIHRKPAAGTSSEN